MAVRGPASAKLVGVREFRARLSAYLRAAAAGATITVGDRQRRPLARLVPATRTLGDEALDRLAAEGVLQRGQGKPGGSRPARSRDKSPLLSDIVIEQRG
jgi:antitoxin (DNA-binding transcriptional repressor) of toxin-antitoxin stability system